MRPYLRRVLGLAVSGLAALLVTGCGAGQITQTSNMEAAVNGAQATGGGIAIRDAALVFPTRDTHTYPAGSDAPLTMSIVNEGAEPDQLLAVSSEYAASARVEGETTIAGNSTLVVGPERGELAADAQVLQSAGSPAPEVTQAGHAQVVLRGLTVNFRPGQTMPVTFTFRDAGTLTVDLPIAPLTEPREPAPRAGTENESH